MYSISEKNDIKVTYSSLVSNNLNQSLNKLRGWKLYRLFGELNKLVPPNKSGPPKAQTPPPPSNQQFDTAKPTPLPTP